MLFNSVAFALFLPIVYLLYWQVHGRSLRLQNALLVAASYVFYGWWDARYLLLIVVSTGVDYAIGRGLSKPGRRGRRRLLLLASLAVNLGLLGVFKYFNFFAASLDAAFRGVGIELGTSTLDIVLPVGISFYTFQTLSYTIDVYRGTMAPTRDPVAFAAYVSFFPQLVAGPIERAAHLLPQFQKPRRFDAALAADGLRQMLWGFTKKILIADNAAHLVERVYSGYATLDGLTIAIGTFLFAIQIYCDFSGYSDIAIGCSKLFGFDLMRNFAFPYFSRNIGEFWSRWHISLSTWFRDYLYIPLGGSRLSHWFTIRNVLVVFVISGLWHGANWTFVVWGLLHGCYYIALFLLGRQRAFRTAPIRGVLPSAPDALRMLVTFALVLVAWVFFRAPSVSHALDMLFRAVSEPLGAGGYSRYAEMVVLSLILLVVEWLTREKNHPLEAIGGAPRPVRWAVYYALCLLLFFKGNFGHVPFIYFQF